MGGLAESRKRNCSFRVGKVVKKPIVAFREIVPITEALKPPNGCFKQLLLHGGLNHANSLAEFHLTVNSKTTCAEILRKW